MDLHRPNCSSDIIQFNITTSLQFEIIKRRRTCRTDIIPGIIRKMKTFWAPSRMFIWPDGMSAWKTPDSDT